VWYDFTYFLHAFTAAPEAHGTVVEVAGGTVVVVGATSDDAEQALPNTTRAAAMGSKRFIALSKIGDATLSMWE